MAKFKSEHIKGFISGTKNALRQVAVANKFCAVVPTPVLLDPEF
jgi:hypothetical protein